jgi:hypothetical protein
MPSLQVLKDRAAAHTWATPTEQAYADQLLAEIDAVAAELAPVQAALTEGIAAKDALAATLEEAKAGLRSLNAQRDPLAARMNAAVRALGDLMGDSLTIGG